MAKQQKIKRNRNIYKHRSRFPKWLGFVLVVILFVAVGFFGGKLLLDAWNNAKESRPPASEPESSQGSSSLPGSTSSEQESSSAPEQAVKDMSGRVMPQEILLDSTKWAGYLQQVKQDGATAVIADLKDEQGTVFYQSQNALAKEYGAVSEQAVDAAALAEAIEKSGLNPIVRIGALKDAVVSRVAADTTYLYQGQAGTAWLDNSANAGGKTWLNPYRENARGYLADLTGELTKAGFKTVILKNLESPNKNPKAMGIDQETVSLSDALKQTYTQVQSEAAKNGAEVMVQYDVLSYYGVNDSIYGGSPAMIGVSKPLISCNLDTIRQNGGLPVLAGIDTNQAAGEAVRALLAGIETGSVKPVILVQSAQRNQLDGYLTGEGTAPNYILE